MMYPKLFLQHVQQYISKGFLHFLTSHALWAQMLGMVAGNGDGLGYIMPLAAGTATEQLFKCASVWLCM